MFKLRSMRHNFFLQLNIVVICIFIKLKHILHKVIFKLTLIYINGNFEIQSLTGKLLNYF